MEYSPMMKHAVEGFEHGLEHFLDGTERSRKFSLLHIDQAIELFIKEKCIRLGKSIYKSDGTTLTIHEAFKSLDKEVKINEKPRLEELHDLRNTIQHKGLLPDANTTKYYVEIGYYFVKRFLKDELDINLEEVLSIQHRALIEGPSPIETPEIIIKSLIDAKAADSAASKIISGYTVLERAAKLLINDGDVKFRFRKTLKEAALSRGTSESKLEKALKLIFMLRGKVLHGDYEPSEKEGDCFIQTVEKILKYIGYEIHLNKSEQC